MFWNKIFTQYLKRIDENIHTHAHTHTVCYCLYGVVYKTHPNEHWSHNKYWFLVDMNEKFLNEIFFFFLVNVFFYYETYVRPATIQATYQFRKILIFFSRWSWLQYKYYVMTISGLHCSRYDTELHLTMRLQFWSSEKCEVALNCHYFQVHSGQSDSAC